MSKIQKLPGIAVFRGTSKEVAAQPIIDRQFVFDIEKQEFYIDTKAARVKCGQNASKIEEAIDNIQNQIETGEIISKDDLDNIIDSLTEEVSEKQSQIEYYDDILYKSKWDEFSNDDDTIHEYYYSNDNVDFGAELHITPIIETLEEYNTITAAMLFPSIDTFINSDNKKYYLIRAKNIPAHDIRIHISVTDRG